MLNKREIRKVRSQLKAQGFQVGGTGWGRGRSWQTYEKAGEKIVWIDKWDGLEEWAVYSYASDRRLGNPSLK